MNADAAQAHKRHVFLWKITRFLTRFVTWLRFGFVGRQSDLKGPFLLVSNHNTNWDPILIHASFRDQIYFVSSEHVLRSRVWGKFIRWAQDPIPRQKSGSAAGTVMAMLRRLRSRMKLAILTDGRSEGQRAKLRALGLEELMDEILITDELGGPAFRKPCALGFELLSERLGTPFERMAYVGDNIAKDFIAPEKLGMRCIWYRNRDGLYFRES